MMAIRSNVANSLVKDTMSLIKNYFHVQEPPENRPATNEFFRLLFQQCSVEDIIHNDPEIENHIFDEGVVAFDGMGILKVMAI